MFRLFQQTWGRWLLAFVMWTLIGLSFASQLYMTQSKMGYSISWRLALSSGLADWYAFAFLSVPVLWLGRHFPLGRGEWPVNIGVHLLASAVFSVLWVTLRVGAEEVDWLAGLPPVSFGDTFRATLVKTFYFNLLVYWVIVCVSLAFEYYRRYQERELRTAELERRLTQAQLQALQMQLNPHFLFNTLHAISSLMHKDVEAADRMITRLSDLLRSTLENIGTQEVRLGEELAFLDAYLEIEQARFGDRLTVHREIEAEALDMLVPNLVLQPLVENAIRHGIEPHARPGCVEIRAKREGSMLQLQVSDNGGGLAGHGQLEEGVGLSNTRARLEQLYGTRHKLEFENKPEGVTVTVAVPWHKAETGEGEQVAAAVTAPA